MKRRAPPEDAAPACEAGAEDDDVEEVSAIYTTVNTQAKLRRAMKSTSPASGSGADSSSGADHGRSSRQGRTGRGAGSVAGAASLASWLWAAVFLIAGLVLCVVPLFNVLGYESSLVLAALASIAGVRQGVRSVLRGRGSRGLGRSVKSGSPPSGRAGRRALHGAGQIRAEDAAAAPFSTVIVLYLRALLGVIALLLVPLCLLLLNGLRVRNCSIAAGLSFFAMMPLCSAACGVCVGVLAGLVTGTARRAYVVGYLILFASLLWSLWRFAAAPAIFSFDPFFGYYPGALYDEDLAISSAFLAARALHGTVVLAGLLVAALLLDGETLSLRVQGATGRSARSGRYGDDGGPRLPLLLASLLFCGLSVLLFASASRLGCRGDVAALQRHLPSELRTPHFILRYRPGGPVARDIRLLAREHELRYAQLHEALGVEPTWHVPWLLRLLGMAPSVSAGEPRVVSYLFDSMEDKRAQMGAGWTYIAKPWRREIYLHHEGWPHPVLRHELAHIFAGSAGDRVLRLATHYGVPQPGLIEGIAVAADWRASGDLDAHQTVRAMRQAGLEPPLSAVFGLGFYRLPASRAYVLAGSFCRFLLTRHGPAPLLSAYRKGGTPTDFAAAFGVPFAQLERDWRAFVDQQPLQASERDVAHDRLRRPAVFHKVCAHELATRKQQARQAAASGDVDRALQLVTTVCQDDPEEPQHQAERLEYLLSAERFDEATQAAEALLVHPRRTSVLESRAAARLGDLAVLRGDLDAARSRFAQAAALPDGEGASRQIAAKLAVLSTEPGPTPDAPAVSPIVRDAVLRVLIGEPMAARKSRLRPTDGRGDALAVYLLRDAVMAQPDLGLPHYILGRLLYERGAYDEAQAELGLAIAAGLPDERFVDQALLLRGQAALLSNRAEEAVQFFTELRSRAKAGAKLLDAEDMLDRARRWNSLPSVGQ